MSLFVEILKLARSLADLAGAIVEACGKARAAGEREYRPRHLAERRRGWRRDKKNR